MLSLYEVGERYAWPLHVAESSSIKLPNVLLYSNRAGSGTELITDEQEFHVIHRVSECSVTCIFGEHLVDLFSLRLPIAS